MKTFNPEDFLIFEGITGSHLYGTNTDESDIDIRGVCIPPLEISLNPFMNFEQKDSGWLDENDKSIYDLGKFMKLCADANPNIVELLFIPDNKIRFKNECWDKILENKSLFISKKAKHTFTGYSFSQLKAIKNHRQWFVDPPNKKPDRKDFGLLDTPILSGMNLENSLQMPHEIFKEEYREELSRERDYRTEMKRWNNYISWKSNRNPKRKELEDRFGYDAKHASHLIRLMTEGKELLLTGQINFPLYNAEEIKEIKNGKYSYDEIVDMAENMERKFESWYAQSTLQHTSDKNKLTDLYFNVIMGNDEE